MILIIEDQGLRDYMEDRYAYEKNIVPNFDYFAVFDGHGGAEVASFLKVHMGSILKEILTNTLKTHDNNISIEQVKEILLRAFAIIVETLPNIIATHTGSTAIILLKHKQHIWVANCGDSRAIMNFGQNDFVELTKDHKPDNAEEYNRITKRGGFVSKASNYDVARVNGMLAVSRSIGDFALFPHVIWQPDIKYFVTNEQHKYIVMATDGVWDVFTNQEIIKEINDYYNNTKLYKGVGKHIVSLARQRNSNDNITMIILSI